MHKQFGAAIILMICSVSAIHAEGADRPVWEIAPSWSCHFIQEFRCSSDTQNCEAGAAEYSRDLKLDFQKGAISYVGGGTFPITNRQHLPELRKSFFVQDQTEFFFQGGMLWRTLMPSFAGTAFTLQAYRCAPV